MPVFVIKILGVYHNYSKRKLNSGYSRAIMPF
jgi:hypothetical protein